MQIRDSIPLYFFEMLEQTDSNNYNHYMLFYEFHHFLEMQPKNFIT